MCIYYTNRKDLKYTKKEHIFPACIGGIGRLPLKAVSDEANNLFSKFEGNWVHKSTIQLFRGFYGPGKRGKIKKHTGTVNVLSVSNNFCLGYMCDGTMHTIPCIYVTSNDFAINCGSFISKMQVSESMPLVYELQKVDIFETKLKIIESEKFDKDSFVVGKHRNSWYLAYNKSNTNLERINILTKAILNNYEKQSIPYEEEFQPTITGSIRETEESNRVYAKIAFNALCYLKDKDFVKNKNFDNFREWILTGKGHSENWINEDIIEKVDICSVFPELSHWCLFMVINNKLISIVCLYGHLMRKYIIGEIQPNTSFKLDAFICDYRNKKEYTFKEYSHYLATKNHERLKLEQCLNNHQQ